MRPIPALLLALILAAPVVAADDDADYEPELLQAVRHIQQLEHQRALEATSRLIERYPTSRLARLLYADLLMARAGALTSIGGGLDQSQRRQELTLELKRRLNGSSSAAHRGMIANNIVAIAANQPYLLLFDQSQSRLYVYRNEQGTPVLETDYYFSIGLKGAGKSRRGDQKTPIGVYHVTHYIDGPELPDLYGAGAFPVNYPNRWDQRNGRSGDGIWLHGTPSNTYSRAPWASDGCMVVSNPDFIDVKQYINPGLNTPVIIADRVDWITTDQWREHQKELLQTLTRWITDRENNEHDAYMEHYSRTDFHADGRDYRGFEGHQRWVNRNKDQVSIEFSNLSIFRYPGENELVLMQYDQSYQSNILNVDSAKELYWRKQGPEWKIVYEGVRDLALPENRLAKNNE